MRIRIVTCGACFGSGFYDCHLKMVQEDEQVEFEECLCCGGVGCLEDNLTQSFEELPEDSFLGAPGLSAQA